MFGKARSKLEQVPRGAARAIKGMKKTILLEISWCEQIQYHIGRLKKGKGRLFKEQYKYKIKCPIIYLGWN